MKNHNRLNAFLRTCHYCGGKTIKVTGKDIYPHRPDLFGRIFYQCKPCDAHVGSHRETGKPLGLVAKQELRTLRQKVHKLFDPIWQKGPVKRTVAYKMLAKSMNMKTKNCHISWFNEDECQRAIKVLES
jgi:hypothetical protein